MPRWSAKRSTVAADGNGDARRYQCSAAIATPGSNQPKGVDSFIGVYRRLSAVAFSLHHLGRDRRAEYLRPIQLLDIRLGNFLLYRIGIEDGRPVLRACVGSLPIELSRIVGHAEEYL